jgi:molybdate transport system ATP-binding protein
VSLLECRCRLRYSSGFHLDVAFATDCRITALFGPSGSGKTSVLSIIAGLRRPDEGLIRLGREVLFDRATRRCLSPEQRHIGYVFQEPLLFPHLTARKNILYGWNRRSGRAQPVEFSRVVQVLELGDLLDRMPHTLSGGQRQRVSLARALLSGPELLLLDEPLVSVDEALRGKVMEYVERVLREWQIPTLCVSHNAEEVRRLAQEVVVLEAGRVIAQGAPGDVLDAEIMGSRHRGMQEDRTP